jgi:MerR family transcriptional regulator, mercuric resistance operon regulatory protein
LAATKDFTIGEISERTGVHIETVRYYEKVGLFPPPPRTEGGHWLYADDHLKRLNFIRRSRELGFTLNEIRKLLGLVKGGNTCGEVQKAAVDHLRIIRRKITDLRRMERTLTKTAAQCEGGSAPDCPIINVLSRE